MRIRVKKCVKALIFIGAIALTIIALFVGSRIWLNYTWFTKLGFMNVFVKMLWTRIGLWFGFFGIFVLFAGLNVFLAFKRDNSQTVRRLQ